MRADIQLDLGFAFDRDADLAGLGVGWGDTVDGSHLPSAGRIIPVGVFQCPLPVLERDSLRIDLPLRVERTQDRLGHVLASAPD
ncbi:hypothetical protein [uncultured Nitratireductor sp.]|uniref:hypothetical protein n=1 Tax=uncultured Nitratireductor sp. TaxID=520953 RepID=UPI0025FEBE5D|nr:hypothetical protein [uncultured Nitratireductor sp.]